MITWKHAARRALVAALIAASFVAYGRGWGPTASAAPIACPPPQVATHTPADGWFCVNPGDNPSGAAETKNPND